MSDVPFQTLTRAAKRRLEAQNSLSSPAPTAETPTTSFSMSPIIPDTPVAPLASVAPTTTSLSMSPIVPDTPVAPLAPVAPMTPVTLNAPVATKMPRALMMPRARAVPKPRIARKAHNTPGNRQRRGADAFIDSPPELVRPLPGGANDLQGRASTPYFVNPFGLNANPVEHGMEYPDPTSPHTMSFPLPAMQHTVALPPPVMPHTTSLQFIDNLPPNMDFQAVLPAVTPDQMLFDLAMERERDHEREEYERNRQRGLTQPIDPNIPGLGMHNLRPLFYIDRCISPSCPLNGPNPHERGLYMHNGVINPRSEEDEEINNFWGASNPPHYVWDSLDRKRAGREQPGDMNAILGFAKHHNFVLMRREELQLDVDGGFMVDYGDGAPMFPPLDLNNADEEPLFPSNSSYAVEEPVFLPSNPNYANEESMYPPLDSNYADEEL